MNGCSIHTQDHILSCVIMSEELLDLQTWDHIVINPPHFYPYIVLAYLLLNRVHILRSRRSADCAPLSSRVATLDVSKLLRRAALALGTTPQDQRLPEQPFVPLSQGTSYQAFREYPTHALEAHQCDRSRLLALQGGIVERRKTLSELQVCCTVFPYEQNSHCDHGGSKGKEQCMHRHLLSMECMTSFGTYYKCQNLQFDLSGACRTVGSS